MLLDCKWNGNSHVISCTTCNYISKFLGHKKSFTIFVVFLKICSSFWRETKITCFVTSAFVKTYTRITDKGFLSVVLKCQIFYCLNLPEWIYTKNSYMHWEIFGLWKMCLKFGFCSQDSLECITPHLTREADLFVNSCFTLPFCFTKMIKLQ